MFPEFCNYVNAENLDPYIRVQLYRNMVQFYRVVKGKQSIPDAASNFFRAFDVAFRYEVIDHRGKLVWPGILRELAKKALEPQNHEMRKAYIEALIKVFLSPSYNAGLLQYILGDSLELMEELGEFITGEADQSLIDKFIILYKLIYEKNNPVVFLAQEASLNSVVKKCGENAIGPEENSVIHKKWLGGMRLFYMAKELSSSSMISFPNFNSACQASAEGIAPPEVKLLAAIASQNQIGKLIRGKKQDTVVKEYQAALTLYNKLHEVAAPTPESLTLNIIALSQFIRFSKEGEEKKSALSQLEKISYETLPTSYFFQVKLFSNLVLHPFNKEGSEESLIKLLKCIPKRYSRDVVNLLVDNTFLCDRLTRLIITDSQKQNWPYLPEQKLLLLRLLLENSESNEEVVHAIFSALKEKGVLDSLVEKFKKSDHAKDRDSLDEKLIRFAETEALDKKQDHSDDGHEAPPSLAQSKQSFFNSRPVPSAPPDSRQFSFPPKSGDDLPYGSPGSSAPPPAASPQDPNVFLATNQFYGVNPSAPAPSGPLFPQGSGHNAPQDRLMPGVLPPPANSPYVGGEAPNLPLLVDHNQACDATTTIKPSAPPLTYVGQEVGHNQFQNALNPGMLPPPSALPYGGGPGMWSRPSGHKANSLGDDQHQGGYYPQDDYGEYRPG